MRVRTFNAGHVPTPVTAVGSSALRGGVDPGDVAHRGCPSPAQHDWDTPYWPVGLRCLISHSTPRIRQTSFNDELHVRGYDEHWPRPWARVPLVLRGRLPHRAAGL